MTERAIITLCLSASGNWDADPEPITLCATPSSDIADHRAYFLARCKELADDCKSGTAWVFINAASLLEYLTNLVIEPLKPDPKNDSKNLLKSELERYTEFINSEWLPASYKEFAYLDEHDGPNGKTKNDLPLQMYCVLRSAMVHSFSMIPESSLWDRERWERSGAPMKFARRGSIVICHRKSGNGHLSNYPKPDAACFVAEDFVQDIRSAVENVFDAAKANSALADRICRVMEARPPLGIVPLD